MISPVCQIWVQFELDKLLATLFWTPVTFPVSPTKQKIYLSKFSDNSVMGGRDSKWGVMRISETKKTRVNLLIGVIKISLVILNSRILLLGLICHFVTY